MPRSFSIVFEAFNLRILHLEVADLPQPLIGLTVLVNLHCIQYVIHLQVGVYRIELFLHGSTIALGKAVQTT